MRAMRKVDSRTPWGDRIGYSRAVMVGKAVVVSGTAAVNEYGKVVGKGDAYAQTVFIIKKIERALKELECSLSDVVRTRIFTTDVGRWREIGRAHSEYFGKVKPATSMIQVSGFIDPEMLVEVEAEAIRD